MLGQEEIKQIGQEIGQLIETNIHPQFQEIYARLDRVDSRLDRVDSRLDRVDSRLDRIEGSMVTQSIFVQRLDALEDRLIEMMQSEDRKLAALIQILRQKNVLNDNDVGELFAMPPFVRRSAQQTV